MSDKQLKNASKPAGLLRRLGALLYDGMLLLSVLFFASFLALPFTGGEAAVGNPWYQAYLVFLIGLYFTWPWTRSGQTLGMQTWRLRLLRADGRPLGWQESLLRFAVAFPTILLFGIGFLWIVLDPENLPLHDRLAKTRMVYEERGRGSGTGGRG